MPNAEMRKSGNAEYSENKGFLEDLLHIHPCRCLQRVLHVEIVNGLKFELVSCKVPCFPFY